MSSRAATQNAANSDIDNEASNAATGGASDTRKRKAPISRPSSAKKTTAAKRKNGKVTNSNDGDAAQDVGSSGAPLQADRDDSLDVDEDEEDEDDGTGSKAGGGPSSKAKPSNRKAQNRNAQRESRQRKAEYVKALEGYVALHKVDLSSQLQGLLFAIGLLIDENMKLRSTLGALSSLFADPTQGSRLPDIGVDIHGLKAAVERNDKTYLLDLGEQLRERVGMHKREQQAEKVIQQGQDKSSGSTSKQLDTATLRKSNSKDDFDVEAPIFGSLTAKAEKELLEKIRISGESFESGGLGMLSGPRSPLKANNDQIAGTSNTQQAPLTGMDELYRVFQHTTRMEQSALAQVSGNLVANAPPADQGGQGSNTGTPVDFNEYLQSNVLNGGSDDIMNMDLNQFLMPHGPSPPGFQMPDFTSLGLPSMPSYGIHPSPYLAANTSTSQPTNLLQPQPNHHTVPSPAFGLPPSTSPSFPLKESPTDSYAKPIGLSSSFTSTTSASPAGPSTKSHAALRETSKTLHKQAMQLIKFHLRSRQEDNTHELPVALLTTAAQSLMPHDPRIDGIIWPTMRDRLVFSNGKIDLEGVLQTLESGEAVIVHATGDLMDPTAWELSETFVHDHPGLLDGEILKSCNKWRMARGDTQIAL